MFRGSLLIVAASAAALLLSGSDARAARKILITPALPGECDELSPGAHSVCDKPTGRTDGPIGELPCEDLEKLSPRSTNSVARIFPWASLTPALQKGMRDSSYPPFEEPTEVAFALSYFQSCDLQKLGLEAIPGQSTASAPSPEEGSTYQRQARAGGDAAESRPAPGKAAADASPILDPDSVPREMVFAPSPKKRSLAQAQGARAARPAGAGPAFTIFLP